MDFIAGGNVDLSSYALYATTTARSLIRRVHLAKVAHCIRMLWHEPNYEDKFSAVMLSAIREDDCVWDIGANIGLYTEEFSKLAKYVVAFEPIQENMEHIKARRLVNVECVQVALGDAASCIPMFVDGQFSSFSLKPHVKAEERVIKVERGDDLKYPAPTVVKIDVEGYEMEVLRGMSGILVRARAAFIEIHFSILDKSGMRYAPLQIVAHLRELGFSIIKWPDASHIAAFKEQPWQKQTRGKKN